MSELTPMMIQYMKIKERHKNCLLLFRLGDFYELFFDDAIIASKELEITLTKRSYGNGKKADMCGVPYHSAEGYIKRLVDKNFRVAICEQAEKPSEAKGIVNREVVRIITPGTVIDPLSLDETQNNYICAVYCDKNGFGAAFADVSTGELRVTHFSGGSAEGLLLDEIEKFKPSEIICTKELISRKTDVKISEKSPQIKIFQYDDWAFSEESASRRLCGHFGVLTLDGFGFGGSKLLIQAAGGLMNYLYETQKNELLQITEPVIYESSNYMMLDRVTRKNLEITESVNKNNKKNCLYWVLNNTKTSMGARLLRSFIEQPLTNAKEITERLTAVSEFKNNVLLRGKTRLALSDVSDIERLITRFIYRSANARDMVSLKASVSVLPKLKQMLSGAGSSYLKIMTEELDVLDDVFELIDKTIADEPPFSVTEGGVVKAGYSELADELRAAKRDGSSWLSALLEKEISETGIKTLKIKNNRVFGYFFEVTNSNLQLVPERYVRRQTLGNCERYTTVELKEIEEKIVGAEQKLFELEYDIFCKTREAVILCAQRIKKTARIIAILDVIQSLAEAADKNGYCMPEITDESSVIDIQKGRHPVVEFAQHGDFTANSAYLDDADDRVIIITGPNMAGKSTFMRQTALIVLMAQIGSFVPAERCRLKPVDKIFTRVGASDDLASGQSTFMVEMAEVANILHNATKDSLIVLDEIGRGTSTFDGLSIAWAVIEYISDKKLIGAKTLFATHYHELTELEGKLAGVKNFCVLVREENGGVVFLRKIQRGGASRSFGAAVAKLAGVPLRVVSRSEQILSRLNEADITKKSRQLAKISKAESEKAIDQSDIFSLNQSLLAEKINSFDVNSMTPVEALQALFELQKSTKGL